MLQGKCFQGWAHKKNNNQEFWNICFKFNFNKNVLNMCFFYFMLTPELLR